MSETTSTQHLTNGALGLSLCAFGRPKIHQTYRYGYIKDVILPRALDDSTFATIASLMLFNNVEVCPQPPLPIVGWPAVPIRS